MLVTGHTGFKGSWLCVWLKSLGAELFGISDRIPTQPSMFESLGLATHVDHNLLDVRDYNGVHRAIERIQPDFIFHLAAQALVFDAYEDPISTFSTNVMGTANLLESLRRQAAPCSVVLITSDKCYENVEWVWGYRESDALGGKDPYSASKACAEHVIHSYFKSFFSDPLCPIRLVAARAGNVIGGGDWSPNRIVPDCIKAWALGEPVVIRRPQSTRPWQHVLEPLSGYLRSAQMLAEDVTLSGEAFNFGPLSNQDFPVSILTERLKTHWFKSKPNFDPIDLRPDHSRPEAGLLKLSCDKALARLQWSPTLNFEETTQLTSDWYSEFYDGELDMLQRTKSQIQVYTARAISRNLGWARS